MRRRRIRSISQRQCACAARARSRRRADNRICALCARAGTAPFARALRSAIPAGLPPAPRHAGGSLLFPATKAFRRSRTPQHSPRRGAHSDRRRRIAPSSCPISVRRPGPSIAYTIKRDFPILHEQVHGKPLVWLDNAATTQKPQSVIDRLAYFYEHENSNIHRAAHDLAARATDAYEAARQKSARFLNAGSERDIIFVRGATEGINLVAKTWGRQQRQGRRRDRHHLARASRQHRALAAALRRRRRASCASRRSMTRGQVMLEEYEKLLGPRTRLVAHAAGVQRARHDHAGHAR